MKRISPRVISLFFILTSVLFVPSFALAGSITAAASASAINSLGDFRITMTSSGVNSCTWSRLDNGTTWAWKDQPLPTGTAYDSGTISDWAGPAQYEWQFTCTGDWGIQYFAAASISISGDTGSILDDITDGLASVIDAVIDITTNPDPATVPAITVLPTPLQYGNVPTDEYREITLTVTNTGGADSLLTGNVTIVGAPDFTCQSGCTYTNIAPGPGSPVVIRFTPNGEGPKEATVSFSGGGGASVPATGTGVTPTTVITATPEPIIAVSPTPTHFYYGVELGDHRDNDFIVKNTGPIGTLLSGSVSITPGMGYTCISGCNYTNLEQNEEHVVTVRFEPTGSSGTRIATVTFTGGGGATRYVNGEAYSLAINENLAFPPVVLGRTGTMTLRIHNPSLITSAGSGTLVIPSPFACVGVCTYLLPPGAHQDFTITFTPTAKGPALATGRLSNFTNSTINLSGTGVRQTFRVEER